MVVLVDVCRFPGLGEVVDIQHELDPETLTRQWHDRHLIMVVDISHTMANYGIYACKEMIKESAKQAITQGAVSLITYAGHEHVQVLQCLQPGAIDDFLDQVDKIQTQPETCFSSALETLMTLIEDDQWIRVTEDGEEQVDRKQYTIFFTTDGTHSDSMTTFGEVMEHLTKLGELLQKYEYAAIHCLGISKFHDSHFLAEVQARSPWPSLYLFAPEGTYLKNRWHILNQQIFPDYLSGQIQVTLGRERISHPLRFERAAPNEQWYQCLLFPDGVPDTHEAKIILDLDSYQTQMVPLRRPSEMHMRYAIQMLSHAFRSSLCALADPDLELEDLQLVNNMHDQYGEALDLFMEGFKESGSTMFRPNLLELVEMTESLKVVHDQIGDRIMERLESPCRNSDIAITADLWSQQRVIPVGVQMYQLNKSLPNISPEKQHLRNLLRAQRTLAQVPDWEKKLRETYKDLLMDLDDDVIEMDDAIDLMEKGDCLCLNLQVERSPLSASHPEKLKINRVCPNFSGALLFQRQYYKAVQSSEEYPEVEPDSNKLMVLGRHEVRFNACLPLYLFPEHWSIARLHLDKCLGMMKTMNPYNYQESDRLPLMLKVLAWLMKQYQETMKPFWKHLMDLVTETVKQVMREEVEDPLETLLQEVEQYQGDRSHRYPIDVPDHELLIARWYVLQELLGPESIPLDPALLGARMAEEEFRRLCLREKIRYPNIFTFCELMGVNFQDWIGQHLDYWEDRLKSEMWDPVLVLRFEEEAAKEDWINPEPLETPPMEYPVPVHFQDPTRWDPDFKTLSVFAQEEIAQAQRRYQRQIMPTIRMLDMIGEDPLDPSWDGLGLETNAQKLVFLLQTGIAHTQYQLDALLRSGDYADPLETSACEQVLRNRFTKRVNEYENNMMKELREQYAIDQIKARASFFVQTSNLYLAAQAFFGCHIGKGEITPFYLMMQRHEAPYAHAKLEMILKGVYRNIRLYGDKRADMRWCPSNSNRHQFWKRYRHVIPYASWVRLFDHCPQQGEVIRKLNIWENRFPLVLEEEIQEVLDQEELAEKSQFRDLVQRFESMKNGTAPVKNPHLPLGYTELRSQPHHDSMVEVGSDFEEGAESEGDIPPSLVPPGNSPVSSDGEEDLNDDPDLYEALLRSCHDQMGPDLGPVPISLADLEEPLLRSHEDSASGSEAGYSGGSGNSEISSQDAEEGSHEFSNDPSQPYVYEEQLQYPVPGL